MGTADRAPDKRGASGTLRMRGAARLFMSAPVIVSPTAISVQPTKVEGNRLPPNKVSQVKHPIHPAK